MIIIMLLTKQSEEYVKLRHFCTVRKGVQVVIAWVEYLFGGVLGDPLRQLVVDRQLVVVVLRTQPNVLNRNPLLLPVV